MGRTPASVKAEAKAVENKVAREVVKDVEKAERRSGRKIRVNGRGAGSFSRQAAMQKHVATANFIAGLFHPFESPSRFPDRLNLLKTVVLPFRETGTVSGSLWALELSPVMQRMLHPYLGTFSFGAPSIVAAAPTDRMFTAASKLPGFVIAARCTGLKIRLQYSYIVTGAQGYLVGAVLPPGFGGGAVSQTALSQYPMSSATSVPDIVTTGCFEMVWLPQTGASDHNAVYAGQSVDAYNPLAFIPFNGDTAGDSGSMPVIQIYCSGGHTSAVFLVTIEGTWECDCICGPELGADVRPSEDAWDVLDDFAEPLFEANTGVQPETLSQRKSALAPSPQVSVVRQMMETAPQRMTEESASFMDQAAPYLSKAGEAAWDLVKDYGPDVLESVVGLLPGGSLATTAAKIGGTLGKFLL